MISVCMAVYNGEKYLREQIESILKQLSPEDELVLSDDASTDASIEIIERIKDSRLILLKNEKRLGPIYNFERALVHCRGDLIFLSDQDDLWLTGKVNACVQKLKEYDLILHDAFVLRENKRQEKTLFELRNVQRGLFKNWWKNSYTGCCMAFKRTILESAMPFPKKIPMHDQWIGICAEKKYRVLFLNSCFIEYRVHDNNATRITGTKKQTFRQRFLWRYYLLKAFLSRFSTHS